MRRFIRHIILVLLLLSGVTKGLAIELYFEHVTSNNRVLPNTSIHGIAKDTLGFIWFGSWHGLYRYDGVGFQVYRHVKYDKTSLPNNRIRNVVADDNKQIWVLTYDKKYVKYDHILDNFQVVDESKLPHNVLVLLNSTNNLLNKESLINNTRFVIDSHHLVSMDKTTDEVRYYSTELSQPGGLSDDYVTSFKIDDQNIIWIGTRSGEIYKANTERKPFRLHYLYADEQHPLKQSPVRTIFLNENQLWLGTNHTGLVYNDAAGQRRPLQTFSDNAFQVRCIEMDKKGDVWVGGIDGLGYVDRRTKAYHAVLNKQLFPNYLTSSVYAIALSRSNKTLWAGMFNQLVKVDLTNYMPEFIDLTNLIGEKSIMKVIEDRWGNIWVATEGGGVLRLKAGEAGVFSDTLKFEAESRDITRSIAGNLVYTLFADQHDNVWVGTSEGLNCIDGNSLKVKKITFTDKLADSYITAITGDKQGNLWISHKKGISKIEPASMKVANFTIKDKYRPWVFLDGACYNDTTTNTLYFGADKGYVSFRPDQIEPSSYKPFIVLDKLYLDGKVIKPGVKEKSRIVLQAALSQTKAIELDYSNRNFTIEMAALHYENAFDNQFVYKLEGYDDQWKGSGMNRIAYSKLPAGTYVFKAKALASGNKISEEKQLTIVIHSPWYATYWALGFYLLFMFAILFVIYREMLLRERLKNKVLLERVNIEKKEELNKDRIEFFTNVSHELRTPLTLIADPIKQLQKDSLSLEKRGRYLSIINRNIEHLSKLINQLLDFRKAETGKLEANLSPSDGIKIVRQCVESFHMNAHNREIKLRFHADKEALLGHFDKGKMEEILFNLISNSFKYTSNRGKIYVTVDGDVSNGQLVIHVKDNGIGIESKSLKNIFEPFNSLGTQPFHGDSSGMGLALTRNLVHVLGGEIIFNSVYQKGTDVKVTLPYSAATAEEVNGVAVTNSVSEEEPTTEPKEPQASDGRASKPLVLVVEDNKDVQEYLKSELEEYYEIAQEENGVEGLKSAISLIPDLIISDVMMPFMDGVSLCKEVKSNEATSHIPLILLTAKSEEENKIEGLQTGADYYIPKPFSIAILKAQIDSIIENRHKLKQKLATKESLDAVKKANNIIDNEYLLKVIEIIQNNISVIGFNNEALAKEMGISPRQLYRKIGALSGSTVQEFITRVKMDEAARLLLSTSNTISQISYMLGFSEPSNFSRTFTKHYGLSASKWAKINRHKHKF